MKLVQKMSIGLSLACTIMLSSCSKEDAQMPEPKVEIVNSSSSLKTEGLPWIFGTKGSPGLLTYPNFWEARWTEGGNPAKYPSGTSTFSKLWKAVDWQSNFAGVPGQPWDSFVTVTTTTTDKSNTSNKSKVGTVITGLKKGSSYYLQCYVASARPSLDVSGKMPTNVKQCNIVLKSKNGGNPADDIHFDVILSGTPNKWIKVTQIFKATQEEMKLDFSATSIYDGKMAYAHLFVGNGAVWEIK